MKKIAIAVLLLSAFVIIYLFIKEQFRGQTLSPVEDNVLSVTYLLIGVCLVVLFRLKHAEKQQGNDK